MKYKYKEVEERERERSEIYSLDIVFLEENTRYLEIARTKYIIIIEIMDVLSN